MPKIAPAIRTAPRARPRWARGYTRSTTAACAGAAAAAKKSRAITRPTNDHAELTNGTNRNTLRATKPGHTRYGSGGRPWHARAHGSDSSKHAPPAEDITASCSGVAPSSARKIDRKSVG